MHYATGHYTAESAVIAAKWILVVEKRVNRKDIGLRRNYRFGFIL